MTTAQTTPAVAPKTAPPSIRAILEGEQFKAQIARVLPSHLTPERMIRVALTAMQKTPKLAECTQVSLFSSLLTLSQLGLEPDGRRAHLIPYENRKAGTIDCQLIIDYKGLLELVRNTGLFNKIGAHVVNEGDLFIYENGEVIRHVPWFVRRDEEKPKFQGVVFAAYAEANFKDGSKQFELMSAEEIDGIRKRSKAAEFGPWKTDWNEMAKKTVFRRLSKWLPLSPECRDAMDSDGDTLAEPNPANVATPMTAQDVLTIAPNAQLVESLDNEIAAKEAAEATKGE